MPNPLLAGLAAHFSPAELALLREARVGIAGAGGLGSNVAMLLCRSGVGHLLLIDHDIVEPSNLNRQHFWPSHVGMLKTDALAENLRLLNPQLDLELRATRLDERNIDSLLSASPIWVEALDGAQDKSLLVERALLLGLRVVAASGLCGYGGEPLRKRRLGGLVVVGDFRTGADFAPPLAPRVTQAAALMADAVLEMILQKPGPMSSN